jgi:UDP-glucose 4-epimerase
MKVLVTGGNGFIGSYVLKALIAKGHEPTSFDHCSERQYEVDVPRFLGDVRDATTVTEAMAHADGFIHLAGILGTQECIANPRPSIETNILGGLNVLEAAARYEIPGVCIGVGNWWMDNTYAITKSTVLRFVAMYNQERGAHINIVRCVNAYGPGQKVSAPFGPGKVRKVIPSFVCRSLSGMPIEIYGDGEQISDMVHVADVASVLVHALTMDTFGHTIEVGPARSRPVIDIAHMVVRATDARTGYTTEVIHLPMRPGEVPNATVSADVTTMDSVGVDHAAFVDITDGIRDTVKWYADHEGTSWHRP